MQIKMALGFQDNPTEPQTITANAGGDGPGTLESVWIILRKLKINLPCNPAIPLLDTHART